VDILLVQTLVMFLLYFTPTPGASGIGEVLSAAVMSSYVPRELTPLYILVWRLTLTYFTLAFGFIVFSGWLRRGLKSIDQGPLAEPAGG
jgi:glycosyltransferase 2 family protein